MYTCIMPKIFKVTYQQAGYLAFVEFDKSVAQWLEVVPHTGIVGESQ